MRLLLDTNVLIDLYTQREPEGRTIERLLALAYFDDAELWASAKSFTDIFYVLRKHADSRTIHAAFRASFEWLHLCSIASEDIRDAAAREWNNFEDCIVSIAAEKVKADYLVTRDAHGFERSTIPVVSPQELFAVLESKHGILYEAIDW